MGIEAVAVLRTADVDAVAVAKNEKGGVKLRITFTRLPKGLHGCHIHNAGDLRGEGCMGACSHYHVGPPCDHGDKPGSGQARHTGDLGNVEFRSTPYQYFLKGIRPEDLLGRTLIIHEDEDDLGKGDYPDSKITGHSGKRIACGIFGRSECSNKTRKQHRKH